MSEGLEKRLNKKGNEASRFHEEMTGREVRGWVIARLRICRA